MSKESVTELLKKYPSYKFAIQRYERHNPKAGAGIANYEAMPSGDGAPELFFAPNSRMADMGHTSLNDYLDYQAYKEIVTALELAMELLTLEEQYVVKKKWIEGVELSKIAESSHYAYITVRRYHKSAINKLERCLVFDKSPTIERIAQL
jgi:DNA-directed RNA polymerase specialized sigma24 family protein